MATLRYVDRSMELSEQCRNILKASCFSGGVSSSTISDAEMKLGLCFPVPYRTFLAQFGAAYGNGVDIAGLPNTPPDQSPEWADVVIATQQTRRVSRNHFPLSYLCISDDGMDTYFYLNVSETGDCPVIALGPGCEGIVIANNFDKFVVKAFNGSIKIYP